MFFYQPPPPCTIVTVQDPATYRTIFACAQNRLFNTVTVIAPHGTQTQYVVLHFKLANSAYPQYLKPVGTFATQQLARRAARRSLRND